MKTNISPLAIGRRAFLGRCGTGLGHVALCHLLGAGRGLGGADSGTIGPLVPKPSPQRARAKNVIFLFMAGGPSQVDLLDPKPEMRRWHGQPVPPSVLAGLPDPVIRGSARVFASPRTFRRHGRAGIELSDYLPHLGTVADELCVVRSMRTDISDHTPAQLLMNCGSQLFGNPCMGSWVTYGLGSESQDLPGFVVMTSNSGKGIDAGTANWSSGFQIGRAHV